ncbi:MAG: AbrB/MazE/SpoVT family DNA-binding domain-containing protein [Acidobacteria bacterium]|nr:AbrB/MazE/SpoVT family DNA-binding domain-containing protein [Acidobacteriota bacterium]
MTEGGKIALPSELCESAQLKPGDTLEIQFYKGTIVLRKHQPLSKKQCAALLERSRSQPKPTPEDDATVEEAVRKVRAQRR